MIIHGLNVEIIGGPPLPPGLPPPPVGMAPPLPPTSATAVLIPQPKAMDRTLASASSVGTNNTLIPNNTATSVSNGTGVSLSLDKNPQQQSSISSSHDSQVFKKKKIKDGLTLVYDAEQEVEGNDGETKVLIRSMEERRSVSARYSKITKICLEKRRMELQAV